MVPEPGFVKSCSGFRPGQAVDPLADPVLLAFPVHPQHVSFLQHPATQAHTPEQNVLAFFINDPLSLCPEVALGPYGRSGQDKKKEKEEGTRVCRNSWGAHKKGLKWGN